MSPSLFMSSNTTFTTTQACVFVPLSVEEVLLKRNPSKALRGVNVHLCRKREK